MPINPISDDFSQPHPQNQFTAALDESLKDQDKLEKLIAEKGAAFMGQYMMRMAGDVLSEGMSED